MSNVAHDHVQLADTITAQVTEPLKALGRRNESLKRKVCAHAVAWMSPSSRVLQQSQFCQKLLSERERFYQDRLKVRVPNGSPPEVCCLNELICCWHRISKRNVSTQSFLGGASTVLTSSQYDGDCAEVDAYRQKQVFCPGMLSTTIVVKLQTGAGSTRSAR
jgi:hypothetical protein